MAGAALQIVTEKVALTKSSFQQRWSDAAEIREAASPVYEAKPGYPNYERFSEIAEVLTTQMELDGPFSPGVVGNFLGALEQNPIRVTQDGPALTGLEVSRMTADQAASQILLAASKDDGLASILDAGREGVRNQIMFRECGWVGDQGAQDDAELETIGAPA